MSAIVTLAMPEHCCLLESAAQPFLDELLRLAMLPPKEAPGGVLILQLSEALDISPAWLCELEDTLLRTTLIERILKFRRLLALIEASDIPWMYAARSDCLGSACELALTCHKTFWCSTVGVVGFPVIAAGGLAPGGTFERLLRRTSRVKERWEEEPVLQVSRAKVRGLIDFAADIDDWREVATAWFKTFAAGAAAHMVAGRKLRTAIEQVSAVDDRAAKRPLSPAPTFTSELAPAFEDALAERHLLGAALPSAWQRYWDLLKENERVDERFAWRVADLAAQYLLGLGHRGWLEGRLVAAANESPLSIPPCHDLIVYVALGQSLPPVSSLARLMHADCAVVFHAGDARTLYTALEQLYARLVKSLSGADFKAFWENSVSWFVGSSGRQGVRLSWSGDERLSLASGDSCLEFIWLKGSDGAGWCELSAREGATLAFAAKPDLRLLVDILSQGLIETQPVGEAQLSLSLYLRLVFLEELLRIAPYRSGSLDEVLEALKETSWGFAGDEDAWDQLLRQKSEAYATTREVRVAGGPALSTTVWQFSSWRQAKLYVRQGGSSVARWNPVQLSHHMALFTGLLSAWLASSGLVKPGQAQIAATVALGFPARLGTPGAFMCHRGIKRVIAHAMREWPRWNLGPHILRGLVGEASTRLACGGGAAANEG